MLSKKTEQNGVNPRHVVSITAPLLIYIILSLGFFGKDGNWAHWFLGGNPDAISFVWFLHWWPFAITHKLNPFISNFVWYPHGDNLTWDTSVPSAALISLPITLLGGPVLSYNVLTVIAPAMSAWTTFLLAKYLTKDWKAALFGGYLFGFSSYELGQMLGHLNLDLTFLVPLVVLVCIRRARGELERTQFIGILTVILLAQLGLSSEILATLCVIGATTWVVILICLPSEDRRGLLALAVDIMVTSLAVIILASPFLYYLAEGLPDVPPSLYSATTFSTDPLNYFIPTIVTRVGRVAFSPLSALFTGGASENGAYLGLPLIFLLALYFRDQIVVPYARALLIAMVIVVIFSLGPRLHVAGTVTNIPLPWSLSHGLPLIHSALPTRFTMYVSLFSAIVMALYLATPDIGRWRIGRFMLASVSCLFLIPNSHLYTWARWPAQKFFTPQNISEVLGKDPNVIILPFNVNGPSMAWQLNAGMKFTQWGGYDGFPPYSQWSFPVSSSFSTGIPGANFANDLAAFCATQRVDYILIAKGAPPALAAAILAQGWPQHMDQDINVVKVPEQSKLAYYYTQGDYWPSDASENWMGRQVRIVSHGTPIVVTIMGKWRPSYVPLKITVDLPSGQFVYSITQSTVQAIHVPADVVLTLTADSTFIPDKVIHNGDTRKLSALISIKESITEPRIRF